MQTTLYPSLWLTSRRSLDVLYRSFCINWLQWSILFFFVHYTIFITDSRMAQEHCGYGVSGFWKDLVCTRGFSVFRVYYIHCNFEINSLFQGYEVVVVMYPYLT